ncbi:MAG: DUF2275 domain-containing protein [Syntrophorhabdaceae bacterium]|nr:DUF2275 domain-containing protein [Syntrophorhabdaceae bacterium]
MTRCGEMEERLGAYLEDFLDEKEKKALEEHLSACPHCRHTLEDLRKTKEILAGMDEVDPPPWLTEKIMAQIHEGHAQKEGFFRRLFFPLHIKIPVQALATVFVVALSVYLYKSTLPEMANMERPVLAPQVSGTQSPAGTNKATADDIEKSPAGTRDRSATEGTAQKKATPRQEAAPAQSGSAYADKTAGPSPASIQESAPPLQEPPPGKTVVPERSADDAPPLSKKAPPESLDKARKFKTRGMAMREGMGKAGEPGAMPPLRSGAQEDAQSRITVLSANPPETAREVRAILRSLGCSGVDEKKSGQVSIVSGWIDIDVLSELKKRLKEIAVIDEGNTVLTTDAKSALIEIVIRKTADGDESKPAQK